MAVLWSGAFAYCRHTSTTERRHPRFLMFCYVVSVTDKDGLVESLGFAVCPMMVRRCHENLSFE